MICVWSLWIEVTSTGALIWSKERYLVKGEIIIASDSSSSLQMDLGKPSPIVVDNAVTAPAWFWQRWDFSALYIMRVTALQWCLADQDPVL